MKKVIIVIGIVIAVFVVWIIVDQSRLMSWYLELNYLFNDNYPLELHRILDNCFNGKYDNLLEREWSNKTHFIDNVNCEWNLLDDGAMQP